MRDSNAFKQIACCCWRDDDDEVKLILDTRNVMLLNHSCHGVQLDQACALVSY